MTGPSERYEALERDSDQTRAAFFRTELASCFMFVDLAEAHRRIGSTEHAQRSIADARHGYDTLSRILADPRYVDRMTPSELQEFRTGLQRLRDRLDRLDT